MRDPHLTTIILNIRLACVVRRGRGEGGLGGGGGGGKDVEERSGQGRQRRERNTNRPINILVGRFA